jgi:enterochelin esterase-like enzyme
MAVVDEQRDKAVQEADASCLASIQEAKSMYNQVVQALEARNTASIEEAHVRHIKALRVIEESYAESVGQIQNMVVEVVTAAHAVMTTDDADDELMNML